MLPDNLVRAYEECVIFGDKLTDTRLAPIFPLLSVNTKIKYVRFTFTPIFFSHKLNIRCTHTALKNTPPISRRDNEKRKGMNFDADSCKTWVTRSFSQSRSWLMQADIIIRIILLTLNLVRAFRESHTKCLAIFDKT